MGIAAAYSQLGTQVWIPNYYVIQSLVKANTNCLFSITYEDYLGIWRNFTWEFGSSILPSTT